MKTVWTFRLPMSCAALLALFACSLPAVAEIYRWTDPSGKVHYTERKPADRAGGEAESLQGSAGVSFVGGGNATGATPTVKVRMFMTRSCPYCKKAKAFLQKRGIPYEELDIEASSRAKAEYDRLGGRGVPVILVGEQRLDGFDARSMERILAAAGL
ncbi:MAG TPA: glutaredoxin domain-containing protein [Methylococcaceae bacterium]|nr:glutaredoxin domain-containing protein [Methylococcaceae bacterium]